MNIIEMLSLTKENKEEFTAKLKKALYDKFGEGLPDNYGYRYPWSLLSLVRDNILDTYQLLYVNGTFWTATGGILREFEGTKVYQAVFRGFSYADPRHKGLGVKSYTHQYNTKFQIERAITHNCKNLIISFNEYNYKLFVLNQRYLLPRALANYDFRASSEPVMFNGVKQWLLTLNL